MRVVNVICKHEISPASYDELKDRVRQVGRLGGKKD
jgi:hypothetical protein